MTLSRTLSGVFALLSLAASPVFAQAPVQPQMKINICGGGTSGTYIKVAKYVKYMLEASGTKLFDVTVLQTAGSKENIAALNDGRCQVAVIQNDANYWFDQQTQTNPIDLRVVSQAYNEHAHLLCHKDLKVGSFADLEKLSQSNKAVVFVGSEQSGGAMMLENLINFYPKDYAGIVPMPNEPAKVMDPKTGKEVQKYDATQNSIQLAIQNKACAFFVTRAPYKVLTDLDAKSVSQLQIASLEDRKFDNLVDAKGNRIYNFVKYADIDSNLGDGIYGELRPDGWWSSKAEYTIMTSANLVVNTTWEQNTLGDLANMNQGGTVTRWQSVLDKVKKFNGSFTQIDSLLAPISSQPIPAAQQ